MSKPYVDRTNIPGCSHVPSDRAPGSDKEYKRGYAKIDWSVKTTPMEALPIKAEDGLDGV